MDSAHGLAHNPRFLPREPCLNTIPPSSVPDIAVRIADELNARGWAVIPDFVPPDLLQALREECLENWRQGEFRHAGVGRGEEFEIRPELRSDRVLWLEPGGEGPAQRDYLQRLEELRQELNRQIFLGLFEFEGHMAVYPPGSFYARHLDQFRGIGLRTVTAILYLNREWQADDGGQLRLYTVPGDEETYLDILPIGGQLVVFMSAEFMHEVLPAGRERMSITGWFKRRDDSALS
jgi:SM-20-related protein